MIHTELMEGVAGDQRYADPLKDEDHNAQGDDPKRDIGDAFASNLRRDRDEHGRPR